MEEKGIVMDVPGLATPQVCVILRASSEGGRSHVLICGHECKHTHTPKMQNSQTDFLANIPGAWEHAH